MKKQQWEFCIVSTPPPGPLEVYISFMRLTGMERHVHRAKNWDDGMYRLLPEILAQLGMDGWQIAHVDQAGTYFMQRLIVPDNEPDE